MIKPLRGYNRRLYALLTRLETYPYDWFSDEAMSEVRALRSALMDRRISLNSTRVRREAHGCLSCGSRCDASNRRVTPVWRNVYCEADPECRSLTKAHDGKSPRWCPNG